MKNNSSVILLMDVRFPQIVPRNRAVQKKSYWKKQEKLKKLPDTWRKRIQVAFIKHFANQLRTAISDIRVVEVKFLAQDVNTIVWQRTLRGTHEVEMQGIPPSGKKVRKLDIVNSYR